MELMHPDSRNLFMSVAGVLVVLVLNWKLQYVKITSNLYFNFVTFQCILSDIAESKLSFEVYDKDMIGIDDTIGCAFVNLSKKSDIVVRNKAKLGILKTIICEIYQNITSDSTTFIIPPRQEWMWQSLRFRELQGNEDNPSPGHP